MGPRDLAHPEVAVELTTSTGEHDLGIWDSQVTHFELTFARGSIDERWLPSQEGTDRTWDVSSHPRWRPLLAEPITDIDVSTSGTNDSSVRAPVAVRLANHLTEGWIVAGPPSPVTI